MIGDVLTEPDIETMLFYAFRYALGRQTYAVKDVVDLLLKCEDFLSSLTMAIIVREIMFAIDSGQAGMLMDREQWLRVVEEYSR